MLGNAYEVQYAIAPDLSTWLELTTVNPATSSLECVADSIIPGQSVFYRIQLLP